MDRTSLHLCKINKIKSNNCIYHRFDINPVSCDDFCEFLHHTHEGNSIWGCSNYVSTPCHRWTGPQPRNAPCVTHMLQVPFCPSSLSSLPLSPLLAAHSFLTELMFVRSARKTLLWEQRDAALSTSILVGERLGERLRGGRRDKLEQHE